MTKYERERIEAMMRLGCVFCAVLGVVNAHQLECHHIVEGNRRLGHWYTLPACIGHHRGHFTPEQVQILEALAREKDLAPHALLVGIASGSKAFEPYYGTEREMWTKVQRRLKLPAMWVHSKIVPRWVSV